MKLKYFVFCKRKKKYFVLSSSSFEMYNGSHLSCIGNLNEMTG